jgi:hypothetical protein
MGTPCTPSAGGAWRLAEKHFFNQRGARLTAADYHGPSGMLVAAFSNGVFDLYEVRPPLARMRPQQERTHGGVAMHILRM